MYYHYHACVYHTELGYSLHQHSLNRLPFILPLFSLSGLLIEPLSNRRSRGVAMEPPAFGETFPLGNMESLVKSGVLGTMSGDSPGIGILFASLL